MFKNLWKHSKITRSYEITKDIEERLAAVQNKAGLETEVEVIQRALALYDHIVHNDCTITMPDGKEVDWK